MEACSGPRNSEMEGTIMERNKNDGCLEDFLGRYRALMDRVQVPDELHQKLMRRLLSEQPAKTVPGEGRETDRK